MVLTYSNGPDPSIILTYLWLLQLYCKYTCRLSTLQWASVIKINSKYNRIGNYLSNYITQQTSTIVYICKLLLIYYIAIT